MIKVGVVDTLRQRRSQALRDHRVRQLWKDAAERADQNKVARIRTHVDAQLAELPESHRHRRAPPWA